MVSSIFEFSARVNGRDVQLRELAGRRWTVVVLTASRCSFSTANLSALAALCSCDASATGDVKVIGFPCNQFASQEPLKRPEEIQTWACETVRVPFPVADDLVRVKQGAGHVTPLFELLQSVGAARWNYTKFVCDGDGIPILKMEPNDVDFSSALQTP
mmetsp:Transcript_15594/g.17976  ORF Transcript_15594/g.17976 Transcript_15594/m.17976 type:complete len:158 (+) Transcript_15594:46-519(+)